MSKPVYRGNARKLMIAAMACRLGNTLAHEEREWRDKDLEPDDWWLDLAETVDNEMTRRAQSPIKIGDMVSYKGNGGWLVRMEARRSYRAERTDGVVVQIGAAYVRVQWPSGLVAWYSPNQLSLLSSGSPRPAAASAPGQE